MGTPAGVLGQDEDAASLLLQIGHEFFLQVPGRHSHDRPPPFDDDEDGEFKGNGNVYAGEGGSWFTSSPPQRVNYEQYCKSRYRPGDFPAPLTRKDFKSRSLTLWHEAPLPLPHAFATPHPCTIKFRLLDSAAGKMPWIALDGQVMELNPNSSKMIKHVLGGRLSIVFEQLKWDGPWASRLTTESRAKYTQLFRQMDVDNSGTVDGGELEFAFEQLNIEMTPQEIITMVNKHAKKHEGEVTQNEFFEMMEDQVHGGRAWFVTLVCVIIPNVDYDHEILSYREEEKTAQFESKVQDVFDRLQEGGCIKPSQVELGLEYLQLNIDPDRLAMLVSNIGETLTLQDFQMLVENQHVVDTKTHTQLMDQANRRRRLEQRAKAKLLHIKGNERKVRVVETELHYTSLNAGDVFLLDAWNGFFLWIGKEASEPEADAGRNQMNSIAVARKRHLTVPPQFEEMVQGEESEVFWELLGGQGPIAAAEAAGDDDMVEGLPEAYPPIPERSKMTPKIAIVGAGVAGAICAKSLRDHFKCDVVVFESEPTVGGRLGSYERGSIPFTAGASYFCAQGPHMKKFLKQLLEESAISEWKPRVGVVGKSAVTSGEYVGFIPAINTQEQEINIEAWIENWPKTGAPPPGGNARPASTFWEPTTNVPIYDLEAPTPIHRRSHAQGFGQGHGSGSWYICKPDMASLVKHLLKGIDVRCNARVQAALPQLGQGTYEIIVENTNGTLTSQGAFNMLLICTPPDQAERLLADCQPSLMSIPQSMEIDPVWTVLVAFDHPIFTPFDVLFVEEDACEPIRSAFRESSRYASYDPMKDMQVLHRPTKQSIFYPDPPQGPIWGGKPHARHHRNAPSINSYGAPVDSWVIHCSAVWSRDNRYEIAKQVAQVAIKAFLRILGLSSAPLRLLVSEAVLWEHGRVCEPAVIQSMKPNVNKALGPYCTFDPVTGIGMAGDWFVEGSVEGAFASGLEIATLAGRSPIMYNQGQANPYGHVQFEITKNLRQRFREGVEVVSAYSSDSRPSTVAGDDWDDLEWQSKVELNYIRATHVQATSSVKDMVRKDILCRNEGCGAWIEPKDMDFHRHHCPFRPSGRCVFAECGKYIDLHDLKQHKQHCEFGVYRECAWCFQPIPVPEIEQHRDECLGKPKLVRQRKSYASKALLDSDGNAIDNDQPHSSNGRPKDMGKDASGFKLPAIPGATTSTPDSAGHARSGVDALISRQGTAALPPVMEDTHDESFTTEAPTSPPKTRATEYSRATTAFPQTAGSQDHPRKD